MKHFFNYLVFLSKSKGVKGHGVHSPFVYDFVSKGLKGISGFSPSKSNAVYYKSVEYFKPDFTKVFDTTDSLEQTVLDHYTHGKTKVEGYKLFYFNKPLRENEVERYMLSNVFTNKSIVILKDIHTDDVAAQAWRNIKDNPKVSITLDLFHTGLACFIEGKVKEHFAIRV